MKKSLKLLSFICILSLLIGSVTLFTSCKSDDDGKLKIVTTVFPIYDMCRNVLGDRADDVSLTMLLDSGVDLHSYQPSAKDMAAIAGCDLFIYIGGESDEWAEDALTSAPNENRKTLNLMEHFSSYSMHVLVEEEDKEGMQTGEEEGEEEIEYDEHIWLSLKMAERIVSAVSGALQQTDAENASVYTANASSYIEKIDALDKKYSAAVDEANVKTLVFADRFPFLYLMKQYGLDYYAAFSGCSAESEASFETVTFLAGKIDELGLSYVMTIEGSSIGIAETVIQSTEKKNQQILTLNSLQSVTAKDVADGVTYLGVMEENLTVLKTAMQNAGNH